MLFELTNSLTKCSASQETDVVRAVTNLLIGYYEGNLLLSADIAVINYFKTRVVHRDAKLALKELERKQYSLVYPFVAHIDVVLDKSKDGELVYTYFRKTYSIQKTRLVCENLDDCRFYIKIAKEKFNDYNIDANMKGCGGSTMDNELENQMKNEGILLAFVDSDKCFPSASIGNTAQNCQEVCKTSTVQCRLKILDVHEVENLVPLGFVVRNCDPNDQGRLFIEKLKQRGILDKLLYYDYKNGITLDSISGDKNKDYRNHAKLIFNNLYSGDFDSHIESLKTQKERELKKKRKKQTIKKEDRIIRVFPMINKNIIGQYLNFSFSKPYSSKYYDSTYKSIDPASAYRDEICEIVLAYACVRAEEPIN